MNRKNYLSLILPAFLFLILPGNEKAADTTTGNSEVFLPIIPQPVSLEKRSGHFLLSQRTAVVLEQPEEQLEWAAADWNRWLSGTAGFQSAIRRTGKSSGRNILVRLNGSIGHPEGYRLEITPRQIRITASQPAGVFYAFQTLIQIAESIEPGKNQTRNLPGLIIEDQPRFVYRGMHLDVGRHFFPVDFVKKYIDLLARYKMSRFHWHLTEDQGWRIEVKRYPKLQEVAAYRKETLLGHYRDQPHQFDGRRYGGYYTQEEIREIVRYAQERFITIIPEIEMPGHSQAALSAYPELGCTGGPYEAATKWGVFEDVYCTKEETFEFLKGVLTEVIELFPSDYIHIGGDECPKARWKTCSSCQKRIREEGLADEQELQSYFIKRIESFLNAKGKNIIGWDEILEGGLAPNATVMSWRGVKGGIEAARQNHDVIMTPTSHCYFDYYQSKDPGEPLAIGGFLPLEQVYGFDPVPEELSEVAARHILGAQGNIWTEYIPSPEKAEYMAFPRGIALAEVVWSYPAKRDFEEFLSRLRPHLVRLKQNGVNVADHVLNPKE